MQRAYWHQFHMKVFFKFFRNSESPGKQQPEDSLYTSDDEADPPAFPEKTVIFQFHYSLQMYW